MMLLPPLLLDRRRVPAGHPLGVDSTGAQQADMPVRSYAPHRRVGDRTRAPVVAGHSLDVLIGAQRSPRQPTQSWYRFR